MSTGLLTQAYQSNAHWRRCRNGFRTGGVAARRNCAVQSRPPLPLKADTPVPFWLLSKAREIWLHHRTGRQATYFVWIERGREGKASYSDVPGRGGAGADDARSLLCFLSSGSAASRHRV